jgi:mono/diheme cytochrome c family protein
MCRFGWILSGALALAVGILLYQFVIRGSVAPSPDGRTAIVLSEAERDLVLSEMRSFLVAVQGIVSATASDDFERVAEHARSVGMAAQTGVPAKLIGKLPLAFKELGFATHDGFDRLALDAQQVRDTAAVQPALAELLQKCVACHASYRLLAEGS